MKKLWILPLLLLVINFGIIFVQEKVLDKKIEEIKEYLAKQDIGFELVKKERTSWFFWDFALLLDVRLQVNFIGNHFYIRLKTIRFSDKKEILLPNKIPLQVNINRSIREKMQIHEKYSCEIINDKESFVSWQQEDLLTFSFPKVTLIIKENNTIIPLEDISFQKFYKANAWSYSLSGQGFYEEKLAKIALELKKTEGFSLKNHMFYGENALIIDGASKKDDINKVKGKVLVKNLSYLFNITRNIINMLPQHSETILETFKLYEEKLPHLARDEGEYKVFDFEETDQGIFVGGENIVNMIK